MQAVESSMRPGYGSKVQSRPDRWPDQARSMQEPMTTRHGEHSCKSKQFMGGTTCIQFR